jgi:putative ABC transport system substrate-binding protein
LNTKILAIIAAAVILAFVQLAEAQQAKIFFQIGILGGSPLSSNAARLQAFRQGLAQHGYVEGKNTILEYRYAEGQLDRLPGLAAELVRLKVDVIVTAGPQATRPAKEATITIPIVMAQDSDPVGNGFVASLARPGGNITGLSNFASEINGKRLELLKETVPKLSRVAVLGSSTEPGNAQALRETDLAAAALRVQLQHIDVRGRDDIDTAFRAATKGGADAVLVFAGEVFNSHRSLLAQLAAKSRLPAVYVNPEFVEEGGLLTYGISITDLWRRAATYVDKILKGAKPADLPVEQPMKFELVINLKTAKQIGLTIPPNVLARADRVIK